MNNLLGLLVTYLDSKTSLTTAVDLFYNEMPEDKDKCVLIQEIQTNVRVLPQIDAEVHRIKITARDLTNTLAGTLAQLCWRWLLTDNANYDIDKREDTTGFITLVDGGIIQVQLFGNPVWQSSDQKGRKYYDFYATVITKR